MRQVPLVTRFSDEQVVGFVGHQEFGSVGISEKDGACGFQSRNKRYVLFGDIIFAEKGACGAGPTGNINAALDGKRHAVEGPELRAAQYRSFRHMRLLADSLGVQMDKRIQLRLQRLDSLKMEFNDFDGRDVLGSNFLCDFRQGAVGEEAHGCARVSADVVQVKRLGKRAVRRSLITVDDGNGSQENSNCAWMGRA